VQLACVPGGRRCGPEGRRGAMAGRSDISRSVPGTLPGAGGCGRSALFCCSPGTAAARRRAGTPFEREPAFRGHSPRQHRACAVV